MAIESFKCRICGKRIELKKPGSFMAKFIMKPGKVQRKIYCSLGCANKEEDQGLETKMDVGSKPTEDRVERPPEKPYDKSYAVPVLTPEKQLRSGASLYTSEKAPYVQEPATEAVLSTPDQKETGLDYKSGKREDLQYSRIEMDPIRHAVKIVGSPKTQIEHIMDLLKRYNIVKDISAGETWSY